jgi:putative Mg2+ transporter-C (MgtC) family protein
MALDAAHLEWTTIVVRLAVGGGLGLLIGIEREIDGHEAGARTHALLALGAALLGAISVGAFHEFVVRRATTNVQVDVTRVASYVAAGIRFLGAGAIMKRGSSIKGLTTAASLWVAAAVGLASGLGFWAGALAGAFLALAALLADHPLHWVLTRHTDRSRLVVSLADDAAAGEIIQSLVRDLPPSTPVKVERFDGADDVPHVDMHVQVRDPADRAIVFGYAARRDVRAVVPSDD